MGAMLSLPFFRHIFFLKPPPKGAINGLTIPYEPANPSSRCLVPILSCYLFPIMVGITAFFSRFRMYERCTRASSEMLSAWAAPGKTLSHAATSYSTAGSGAPSSSEKYRRCVMKALPPPADTVFCLGNCGTVRFHPSKKRCRTVRF